MCRITCGTRSVGRDAKLEPPAQHVEAARPVIENAVYTVIDEDATGTLRIGDMRWWVADGARVLDL